ncbi:MAG: hypothetical protein HY323_19420, partial [Betaproteobacteria bacterium]|nr:hypothetical protein [Betaproteobacteria bacterium]
MSTRESVHGSPLKTTSLERQFLAAGIIGRRTMWPTVACLRRAGAPLALVAFFLSAAWIDVDATAQPVRGDAYPTKPLRVIVPFPAGGGTDILARMIGAKITEAWG